MTTPMLITNISFACHATQVGCFAQLSDIPHSHVRMSRRLFRNADLAVLNTLTESHPGTASWPLIGLGLPLDPPVGMGHSTSHLVEAEEAHFAVTLLTTFWNARRCQPLSIFFIAPLDSLWNGKSAAVLDFFFVNA